jgi:hypothetical protein
MTTRAFGHSRVVGVVRVVGAVLLLSLAGCAYHVTPPATVERPVSVTLLDMGRHSEIVFPRDGDAATRYAFGEWEWFALGHDNPLRALNMLGPSVGTLGREEIPDQATLESAVATAEHSWTLTLDADKVSRVRDELDRAFEEGAKERVVEHAAFGLTFVPVRYNEHLYLLIGNNCNDATARWLRDMGCLVKGSASTANFTVNPPRDAEPTEVPAPSNPSRLRMPPL